MDFKISLSDMSIQHVIHGQLRHNVNIMVMIRAQNNMQSAWLGGYWKMIDNILQTLTFVYKDIAYISQGTNQTRWTVKDKENPAPISKTNDVQIFHCLVKVYKENKVPAAQNFNWSQHPQRREHPGVRIPRRENFRVTRKFFLMKIQKQGFQTWKNSKKPHKY